MTPSEIQSIKTNILELKKYHEFIYSYEGYEYNSREIKGLLNYIDYLETKEIYFKHVMEIFEIGETPLTDEELMDRISGLRLVVKE